MAKKKGKIERIVVNLSPIIRNDSMEGRPYLVVPMIMILEGVHAGSCGPLYYPAEELEKLPTIWNHKPVVVYHPEINGRGISACDPVEITNRKIGVIMNTEFSDGKLKAEAWIEEDRVKKVDKRVLDAIKNNVTMELSTGLYTENEMVEGEWNGEKYAAIARNYKPDHLALLPDKKGACSIDDGAGFLRLNAAEVENRIPKSWYVDFEQFLIGAGIDAEKLVANIMGHGTIRNLLQSALREKLEEAWVEEVYDGFFIFEENGKLYKQGYNEEDASVEIVGEADEVIRIIEYRTKNGAFVANKRKEFEMDKKKLVDDLISNKLTAWKEENRDFLMKQDEKLLEGMAPVVNEKDEEKETTKKTEPKVETPAKTDKGDEVVSNKKQTVEDYITNAPPEIAEMLNNGMGALKAKKQQLVGIIIANKENTFTSEQLLSKGVPELQALAKLARVPGQNRVEAGYDYSAQGEVVNDSLEEDDILVAPTLNFSEKK